MSEPNPDAKGNIFVVMPFAEEFREIYDQVLKPTIEQVGYVSIRADEIARPGNVNQDIVQQIANSEFVIVDLTGSNPNVMYELGLSHAMSRVTIMISQDAQALPFDVKTYRIILYKQTIEGAVKLKAELRQWIGNVEAARKKQSDPVTDFLIGKSSQDFGETLLTPLECLTSLTRYLSILIDKKAPDEIAKLIRALPTEMTHETFSRHLVGDAPYLENYEALIKSYVDRPDLDDETVFGCPPSLTSLRETLNQIKRSYFTYPEQSDKPYIKEVSSVGFHPYLRSYSLFLLGKMKAWEDHPREYHSGFIFFLNKNGVPIEGIRFSEDRGLRILRHLWDVLLEEIRHVDGGVEFSRERTYVLTQENHAALFEEQLGEPMIAAFREANHLEVLLDVAKDGDRVDVKM